MSMIGWVLNLIFFSFRKSPLQKSKFVLITIKFTNNLMFGILTVLKMRMFLTKQNNFKNKKKKRSRKWEEKPEIFLHQFGVGFSFHFYLWKIVSK